MTGPFVSFSSVTSASRPNIIGIISSFISRPQPERIIVEDKVGEGARIIARQMNSLRGEIDCLKCLLRFLWRQTLLSAFCRSLQRTLERAVNPNREIEVMSICGLEQKIPSSNTMSILRNS